ncbi:hypothetical protein OPV22_022107 [Ensete ventricosum]|uniref:Secreted protein n=1 Tax=Ensete ventricosum TaxID=4639 RepID=A0AAV8QKG7_ENSVE|nr:hypothetical protein OPV22_022107 [Ensete ventricosum]
MARLTALASSLMPSFVSAARPATKFAAFLVVSFAPTAMRLGPSLLVALSPISATCSNATLKHTPRPTWLADALAMPQLSIVLFACPPPATVTSSFTDLAASSTTLPFLDISDGNQTVIIVHEIERGEGNNSMSTGLSYLRRRSGSSSDQKSQTLLRASPRNGRHRRAET